MLFVENTRRQKNKGVVRTTMTIEARALNANFEVGGIANDDDANDATATEAKDFKSRKGSLRKIHQTDCILTSPKTPL